MAELEDRLRRDLTAAMKSRDAVRAGTLRMSLTAVTKVAVSGAQARELDDDEVTAVLASQHKLRREAAAAYDDAGRDDLASRERAEAQVLADYLPEPLGPDELAALVGETVAELGVGGQGMKAMGAVMGRLKPRVSGRADGAVVAAEVRRQLAAG